MGRTVLPARGASHHQTRVQLLSTAATMRTKAPTVSRHVEPQSTSYFPLLCLLLQEDLPTCAPKGNFFFLMSLDSTVLGSSVLSLLCHALLIEKLLIDCLMSSWDQPVLQKAWLGL